MTRTPTFARKRVSWMRKTYQLYKDLEKRGPVMFEVPRFRAWLCCQAMNPNEPVKESLLWKCTYSGQLLMIGDVSVDHRDPMASGGLSTLENLAVCSNIENRRKGKIPHDQYVQLRAMVELWPVEAANDLWGRLAEKKAWHSAYHASRRNRNGS